MPDDGIAVSYCTTCKGRLYQLRETLAHNLSLLGAGEEMTLVDYDSRDGLSEWVWQNFRDAIGAGRLRFFEVLGEAPWHASKAKNLAHRIGRGALLFNLDGDNFLSPEDTQLIRSVVVRGIGCRQGTGDLRDGTPGRIGIQREAFYEIGGYDEGLLGLLVEDLDLIMRAEAAGHRFVRLAPPTRLPLQNDVPARIGNFVVSKPAAADDLTTIGRLNLAVSKLRREMEGPIRRQGFATFRGKLNGEPVILDGLGNLHPAS